MKSGMASCSALAKMFGLSYGTCWEICGTLKTSAKDGRYIVYSIAEMERHMSALRALPNTVPPGHDTLSALAKHLKISTEHWIKVRGFLDMPEPVGEVRYANGRIYPYWRIDDVRQAFDDFDGAFDVEEEDDDTLWPVPESPELPEHTQLLHKLFAQCRREK